MEDIRICLKCFKEFKPTGQFNRICEKCNVKNRKVGLAGGLAEGVLDGRTIKKPMQSM